MLKEERHQLILHRLQTAGRVTAIELSTAFETSEDTIRRDLIELAEQGRLRRVHGGALPVTAPDLDYVQREVTLSEAKAALATAALPLIRDGQVIMMDAGTTNVQLARALPPHLRATVITTSPHVALALMHHARIDVVILGGVLDKPSMATLGMSVVEQLGQMHADVYVLGICGMHPQAGVTSNQLEEAYVKRAMIAQSAETIALVTADKLNTISAYGVAPIDQVAHMVVPGEIDPAQIAPYHDLGITVIRAN